MAGATPPSGPPPVVLVAGALHYDIIVEAPHRPAAGETVAGSRWFPKFGGKGGNQAVACAGAGVAVRMVSAVGDDAFAPVLIDGLAAAGVDAGAVARVAGAGSGMSVAITDASGEYGAVIVSGANGRIEPHWFDAGQLWDGVRLLLLQNEIPEAVNLAAARAARARGVRVCLNAAPWRATDAALLDCVDLVAVNALEAQAMCGVAVSDLDSAAAAARTLSRRFAMALVTAGGAGAVLAAGDRLMRCPARKVQVVSSHGAGDTFIGTLVARLACGDDADGALDAASRAAARHVSTRR